MTFFRSGERRAHIVLASLLVMLGAVFIAAPAAAAGPGLLPGVFLQVEDGTPPATPEVAETTDVAALPVTGDGASQNNATNPLLIGAIAIVMLVSVSALGWRMVIRRA